MIPDFTYNGPAYIFFALSVGAAFFAALELDKADGSRWFAAGFASLALVFFVCCVSMYSSHPEITQLLR